MPNPVVHFEIEGKDGPKLQKFYADLFDWKIDANNPMNYGLVQNGGEGIDGGISGGEASHVTVYVAVDDLATYLKKVQSLGGTVVHGCHRDPRDGDDGAVPRPRGEHGGHHQERDAVGDARAGVTSCRSRPAAAASHRRGVETRPAASSGRRCRPVPSARARPGATPPR